MIFPSRRRNSLNFRFQSDLSGASGAETSKGVCKIDGVDKIPCIRKKYNKSDGSFKAVVSKIDKHRGIMEEFGPKIYQVDHKNGSVYMEYIDCVTLETYLTDTIDPWTKEGFKNLRDVVKRVGDAMDAFHARGVCHTDPNLGNIMICLGDKSVKIIDYDEMESTEESCADKESIREHMMDALSDNIIVRKRMIMATLDAQEESIRDVLVASDPHNHFFSK